MSDLISRQEVSDIIKTRLYQTALNNTEYITSYDKVCEDIAENRIDTWINEAKSVEPEQNLQPTCNQLATDCISRQAATDRFDLVQSDDKCMGYDDILAFLSSLPSVEPERKTGKWIKVINPDTNEWDGEYACSECWKACVQMSMKYCANCGARMEVGG